MVDYSINEDFDLELTDWGDIRTVDGFEEFQQDVVKRLHERERELLATRGNSQTQQERIALEVTRVARDFDVVDDIEELAVARIRGESASYRVQVTFKTGDSFIEQL